MELIALSFLGTVALIFGEALSLIRERLRGKSRRTFPRIAFHAAPQSV